MNKNIVFSLICIASITLLAVIQNSDKQIDKFSEWKNTFEAKWTAQQDGYRKMIFYSNIQKINKHNSDSSQTFLMGINQFTPYSQSQFQSLVLAKKPFNSKWVQADISLPKINAIDWTTRGGVSPVKNQGQCGSCWAFSAVGTLESYSLLKGNAVFLSEQQLVDCSSDYGNNGCDGGQNFQALDYVNDNGITTQYEYTYQGRDQSCLKQGGPFKIKNYQYSIGCSGLASAIQNRPVGVSVDATNWPHYASGIFNNCNTNLNHDVLLVGATDDYWKIKNSWATGWGQKGFIRIAPGNTCGICQDKSPWPV